MAERIDIDGVRFRVGADLKDLEAGFKKGEQLGAEAGKKTGSKFSQAFGAVVSAVAGAQIVGAMKTAFDAANKLEKTMLGLQATAKLTGQSFAILSKSVNDLAKDGVMNIDQAANSMKMLAAQGISAQKSFEFLEAAKKVSAFNNIVGDAGQGVADLVKALQTGSAELFENADPALGAVIKRLGGYAAVSQDATKKQQFLNAVIEKGGKLTGDYDKFLKSGGQSQVAFAGAATTLAQTFGQKLQPAMAAAYNMGAKILTWVSDMIAGLDSTTVAVAAFGTAAFAGIATFAKGAALLPGIFGSIGTAVAGALGPIGLLIAAAGAAFIAFNKLRDAYGKTKGQEMLEERKALEEIGKKQALSISQRERLKQLNAEIAKTYDPILKKLGLENLAFEEQLRLIGAIDRERKKAAGSGAENAARSRAALRESIDARRRTLEGFAQTDFSKLTPSQSAERLSQIERLGASLREDEARLASYGDEEAATGGMARAAGGGKPSAEFRFIRARDELANLARERDAYMKRVGTKSEFAKGLSAQAEERFSIEQQAITKQLRGSIADYIEERYTAEKLALDAQKEEQIRNVRELVNAKAISEKEGEEMMQRIREANARKTAKLTAESFARTMQGANMIAGGFANIVNARDLGGALGGFGGIAQGIGGISEKFAAFGTVGQGIAAAGGIISTLSSLFGKSDAERAREAEEQKRRDEEARALLELQAGYQKNMLALQEAAAKLPFENLSRNLRLIDIEAQKQRVAGGDEATIERQRLAARQTAIQGTLNSEAGSIAAGQLFGGVTADPTSLTTFLSERAAESPAIAQFMALIQGLSDPNASSGRLREILRQAQSYSGKIPPALFNAAINGVPEAISYLESMEADYTQRLGEWGRSPSKRSQDLLGGSIVNLRNAQQWLLGAVGQSLGRAGELSSEIISDTGRAESLLSVIEQQLQTQQEIQKNTKVTADRLSETPGRNSSIIDISRGFSRSLGAIVNPQLTNTGLPQSIAAAVLATDIQKSIQERTVKGIEDLVTIQRDSRELLSIIGKTLAGTNTANSALLVQLEDLYRRSMAT